MSAGLSRRPLAEPFFFESSGDARLFGVWRAPASAPGGAPRAVWVVCAPFAEEEKSAHRTLVELTEKWRERGEASLFFAYRATGDSAGGFASATLAAWRDDITAACAEARRRAPGAPLRLAGLRLGASLAAQVAGQVKPDQLLLIEPVLNGRSYLGAMTQRKKLRAMLTQHQGGQPEKGVATAEEPSSASAAARHVATDNIVPATESGAIEDLDGWPLGAALRAEMEGLSLSNMAPVAGIRTLVVQVGPREALPPPLQSFARRMEATTAAVVMKPFWNLLDYERADRLFDTILNAEI